jgi:MFS family permease
MNTIAGTLAMASPFLAGVILDTYGDETGMRVLYGVMMVAYLASAAVNHRFLKETTASANGNVNWSALPQAFRDAYGGVFTMFKRLPRSLRAQATIIILGFTSNAIASSFWVVYAKEHIGLTATEWGGILLVETLLRTVLLIPAGIAVDRYGRTRFILASLMIAMAGMPLFVLASNLPQVLLIRIAIAVANAFFASACMALMADTVPRTMRGRVMAATGRGAVMLAPASGGTGGPGMGFLTTLPVMLGSVAGGYLYDVNPTFPWVFVTGATAVSVLLTLLFLRDPEHAQV